jgi:hypothetical protein
MNNLPSDWGRHTVFRDNSYSHTIVFPETYVLPDPSLILVKIRRGNLEVLGLNITVQVVDNRVIYTCTKEVLRLIPGMHEQYLVISGKELMGGELLVKIGVGEPSLIESEVTIVEGAITVVQVPINYQPDIDSLQAQITALEDRLEAAEAQIQIFNDFIANFPLG